MLTRKNYKKLKVAITAALLVTPISIWGTVVFDI